MSIPRRVILDTDLGSDVDDAMALAVILGSPSLTLEAVTTVYGDTLLRARLVRRYAALAGRILNVHVGEDTPLSGRPVWWAGLEGSLHDGLEHESVEQIPAVRHLIDTVNANPGDIDLIAIGPLTNIAAAIDADPAFAGNIRHLWIMGGIFDGGPGLDGTGTEHNFRSDDLAAARVFAAGIPSTVTGLEVTEQIEFASQQLDRISAAGDLGRALSADIKQWWDFWKRDRNVPHDPVTVLTLLSPELFEFSQPGQVEIDCGGGDAGRSSFTPAANGSVRLVTGIQRGAVTDAIVDRIEAATASGDHTPSR